MSSQGVISPFSAGLAALIHCNFFFCKWNYTLPGRVIVRFFPIVVNSRLQMSLAIPVKGSVWPGRNCILNYVMIWGLKQQNNEMQLSCKHIYPSPHFSFTDLQGILKRHGAKEPKPPLNDKTLATDFFQGWFNLIHFFLWEEYAISTPVVLQRNHRSKWWWRPEAEEGSLPPSLGLLLLPHSSMAWRFCTSCWPDVQHCIPTGRLWQSPWELNDNNLSTRHHHNFFSIFHYSAPYVTVFGS